MEFKIDTTEVQRYLKQFQRTMPVELRKALRATIGAFQRIFLYTRFRGRPGIINRTGFLAKSFVPFVAKPGEGLWARLASGSKYASTQEHGGRIFPTRRKLLAVPLPSAQTKAGNILGKLIGNPLSGETAPSLYSVPGLFVIRAGAGESVGKGKKSFTAGGSGNLLLCTTIGKSVVPLFVLMPSVYVPPRLGLFSLFRQWIQARTATKLLNRGIMAAIAKAKGKA